jgi:opacity protein-like surface antigen
MMKRIILAAVMLGCVLSTSAVADTNTQIRYDATDLGLGQWQYSYEVSNINLSMPIEEFTIWFDYGLYENLAIATPDPPAGNWDEVIWQPDSVLGNGGYDALTKSLSIGTGESVSGFSVSFNWLGVGSPGAQSYEIINPIDYTTIDSGVTVPEPSIFVLTGLGVLNIMRRNKIKR